MALKLSNVAANAEVSAVAALLNNGYLRIYAGTRPATPDTALSSNLLLAELRFAATAFGAPTAGVATAAAITQDSGADATGTATFFRAFQSDGTTAVIDGDVAASGADANITPTSIVTGAIVQVTAMTLTAPKA